MVFAAFYLLIGFFRIRLHAESKPVATIGLLSMLISHAGLDQYYLLRSATLGDSYKGNNPACLDANYIPGTAAVFQHLLKCDFQVLAGYGSTLTDG